MPLTHGLVAKTQANIFNYDEGSYFYRSEIRQAFYIYKEGKYFGKVARAEFFYHQ